MKNYSKVCWSRKTKAGSPHLHIIETYGDNGEEEFCFWATGWRQLVYKGDTMFFAFEEGTQLKKRKRLFDPATDTVSYKGGAAPYAGEPWKIIILDSLVVFDRKGNEVKRGYGKVPKGRQYGFSGKEKIMERRQKSGW